MDAGIQYSYTRNRQGFFQEATCETPDLQPGENKETQHLTALYLSYKHAIGAYWNWKVGVRYEMADFTYFLNGKEIDIQSKTFRDILPHAMIGYYRDGLSINLGIPRVSADRDTLCLAVITLMYHIRCGKQETR